MKSEITRISLLTAITKMNKYGYDFLKEGGSDESPEFDNIYHNNPNS